MVVDFSKCADLEKADDNTLASCLIYAWALPAHPYNM